MFVEAKYDILRRFSRAPFVSVIMAGYDCMKILDVKVECVPEWLVSASIGRIDCGLGRACTKFVGIQTGISLAIESTLDSLYGMSARSEF